MMKAFTLTSVSVDQQLIFAKVVATILRQTTYALDALGTEGPFRTCLTLALLLSRAQWEFAGTFFPPLLRTKRVASWALESPFLPSPCCVVGYLSHFSHTFGLQGLEISCEITEHAV